MEPPVLKESKPKDGQRPKASMPPLVTGGLSPPDLSHKPRMPRSLTISDPLPPPRKKSPPISLRSHLLAPQHQKDTKEDIEVFRPKNENIATTSLVPPTSMPLEICRHSRGLFQTAIQQWHVAKEAYERWLSDLIISIGTPSQIFVEFADKPTYKTVIRQLLAHVGPSTLDMYSRAIAATLTWMTHFGITWSTLSLENLVAIIQQAKEAARQDVQAIRIQPPQLLRGLRWLARTALMSALANLVDGFLMTSFLKGTGQPKDRKEAVPIPMAVLLIWEQSIVNPQTSSWLVLLLGGFMLATWASLRFADLQRTEVSSLNLSRNIVRGICRLTKTTRTGQPFGIILAGLTATSSETSWVVSWLRKLQQAYTRSSPFKPDFIIPVLDSYDNPSFASPLSYAAALRALRWAVQTPWTTRKISSQEANNFTLHSLKVTLLSSAAQLRLPRQRDSSKGTTHRVRHNSTHEMMW